jgi:hypothetical protein
MTAEKKPEHANVKERLKDIEYAQERRANPELIKKEARKRTLPSRMERAAQKLGFE